jgi:hypothetical protein
LSSEISVQINNGNKEDLYLSCYAIAISVEEPHHFDAAPAPDKIFCYAAPAPTLLYSKAKFLKRNEGKQMLKLFCSFDSIRFILLKYELNGI